MNINVKPYDRSQKLFKSLVVSDKCYIFVGSLTKNQYLSNQMMNQRIASSCLCLPESMALRLILAQRTVAMDCRIYSYV